MAPAPIDLDLMGDWGNANLHLVAGWLAAGLRRRTAPSSRFRIHTLGDRSDPLEALLTRDVDVATAPAAATLRMAHKGKGIFEGDAHPGLRTLAVLPHRDRIALALRTDVARRQQVRRLEDLGDAELSLATARPATPIRHAADALLSVHGLGIDSFVQVREVERPAEGLRLVEVGEVDALLFEGISSWHQLDRVSPLTFLITDSDAMGHLPEFGLEAAAIEAGEFTLVEESVVAVDFSGWVITAWDELDDDIAEKLAATVVEDSLELERHYRHRPREESALRWPIVPFDVGVAAGAPLHPGAARFFRSLGVI